MHRLDLNAAREEGLDLAHGTAMGVTLRPASGDWRDATPEGLPIQTDTWMAQSRKKVYVGSSSGAKGGFFVGAKQKQQLVFAEGFEGWRHARVRAGEVGSRKIFVATKIYV